MDERVIDEGQKALVVKGAVSSYIQERKLALLAKLRDCYLNGTITQTHTIGIAGEVAALDSLLEDLNCNIASMKRERARNEGA